MDEIIYIPSIALWIFIAAIYMYRCKTHSCKVDVSVLVGSVFSASGVVGGGTLMINTIYDIGITMSNMKIYIFISGLSVLCVSAQTMYSEIWRKPRSSQGGTS